MAEGEKNKLVYDFSIKRKSVASTLIDAKKIIAINFTFLNLKTAVAILNITDQLDQ